MSKKSLTKLLAFTMCAGLVLQPVSAFAAETGDEDLTEPVATEEELPEETRDTEDALPRIENIQINGDIMTWDPLNIEGADLTYWVGFDDYYGSYKETSANLRDLFIQNNIVEAGQYEITIFATDQNTNMCSQFGYVNYDYSDEPLVPTPGKQIVISKIEAESNFNVEHKIGDAFEDTTFNVITDVPVEVRSYWCKRQPDGAWWTYNEGVFEAGTYRFQVDISLVDGPISSLYILDDKCILSVNNLRFTRLFGVPGILTYASYSFDIEEPVEPIEKTKITSANVSSNYETIPELYGYFWSPTFEVEDELPIKLEGRWVKKVEGSWERFYDDKTFEYAQYRFEVDVEVDDEHKSAYELDPSFTLTVNGKEWTKIENSDENSDEMVFASEAFIFEEFIPGPIYEEEGQWIEKYGAKYYELPDGKKATGIQKIGDDSYLFSKNGTLQRDVFYEENGNKYYFGSDGKMVKGWFDKWSARYYTNEDGVVQTGFVDIEGNTYYFDAKGKKAASLWVNEDGKRFYIKADGRMAKAETINRWGKKYTFGADGVLIK